MLLLHILSYRREVKLERLGDEIVCQEVDDCRVDSLHQPEPLDGGREHQIEDEIEVAEAILAGGHHLYKRVKYRQYQGQKNVLPLQHSKGFGDPAQPKGRVRPREGRQEEERWNGKSSLRHYLLNRSECADEQQDLEPIQTDVTCHEL